VFIDRLTQKLLDRNQEPAEIMVPGFQMFNQDLNPNISNECNKVNSAEREREKLALKLDKTEQNSRK
jgi:hypothetical protein